MSTQIGSDLRALRKARGWTLQDVAGQVGRSVGWLSQIERGQTTASVRDLSELAKLLGVTVSFFFRSESQSEQERGVVVRTDAAEPIGSSESGLTERLLSPYLNGQFEIIQSEFAPQSTSETVTPAEGREDGGVVLTGRLTLEIDGHEHILKPGDSFQFRGKPYRWRNDETHPATVVWIISPPLY